MVKHDSFGLNRSFQYTISCNVDIVECIIFIGKLISHKGMLFFVFYHYLFTLNIYRDHIQVSVGVLLHPYLKKALFK